MNKRYDKLQSGEDLGKSGGSNLLPILAVGGAALAGIYFYLSSVYGF
jgi:hypothetical protein